MELETELLLQKWLKIQIWKYRLSFIFWIFLVISFLLSGWLGYNYLLPVLNQQMKNTQIILEQITTLSETGKNQEELFENLEEVIPR